MADWVLSLSGDQAVNLDRMDGITILDPPSSGGQFLVIAERHAAPNVILTSCSTKQAARDRVAELIGAP